MRLHGKRVLIVEDEYMIAADLRRALSGEGADVIGPVGSLDRAMVLAEAGALDAAVLDLNLEGSLAYPVADRLEAGGVPYMLVTGYDSWAVPAAYGAKPTLAKPYSLPAVVDAISALCGSGDAR